MRKLSDEGLQVLAPLLRGMNVSEEVSQCIREELVTKVMKCDKLIQDISPFIKIKPQHLPIQHSGIEYKLANFLRVVHKNTSGHEVTDTLNERPT